MDETESTLKPGTKTERWLTTMQGGVRGLGESVKDQLMRFKLFLSQNL
jgi:hypothetical protein